MRFYLAILLFLLLLSCGQKGTTENTSQGSVPKTNINTDQLASSINFNCGESSCPSSFALIIKNESSTLVANSDVCSGFFISQYDVITSRKCMGDFIQKCSTGVAVKDIYGNSALCKNITQGHSFSDNFVHIKLAEPLKVEVVKFSDDSFKLNNSYNMWNINKSYENDTYSLEKTSFCRMTKNNVRFPVQQIGSQREVILVNCPPRDEALGSAIVDSKGELVGLAISDISQTDDYNDYMWSKKGRSLLAATPLKCLASQRPDLFPTVSFNSEQKKQCENDTTTISSSVFSFLLSKMFLGSNAMSTSKVVTNKSVSNNIEFYKIDHPACINDILEIETIEHCKFSPYITNDYEAYRTQITRCKISSDLKFRVNAKYIGLYEVGVFLDREELSKIYLQSCNK